MTTSIRLCRSAALAAALLAAPSTAHAQPPPAPNTATTEAEPLRCWWRTTAGGVRMGEPFSVVLTCGVLDTEGIKVVPDQSRIDPSVMQLAPFEVLGGSHGADLIAGDERFFQYEYRVRLIGDTQFGRDVKLPETRLTYRVQSRVGQGTAAIDGREKTYILPPLSIRVLSVVPADAADIRDSSHETFTDIDARTFRANALLVVGGILFTLAGLLAILALVRLFGRLRKKAPASERLVGDPAVLRGLGRELSAVQKAREQSGWDAELARRALAALRIAGGYALARRVSQSPAGAGANTAPGALAVRSGWLGQRVVVSGSVTAQAVAQELARTSALDPALLWGGPRSADTPPAASRPDLEALEQALGRLTAAQYGRDDALDERALDEALAAGARLVRTLRVAYAWPMRKIAAARRATTQLGTRVWSR